MNDKFPNNNNNNNNNNYNYQEKSYASFDSEPQKVEDNLVELVPKVKVKVKVPRSQVVPYDSSKTNYPKLNSYKGKAHTRLQKEEHHQRLDNELYIKLNRKINQLEETIKVINKQLNKLFMSVENNNKVNFMCKNIHDILLFIIFGVFVILLIEIMFNVFKMKIGKL